VLVYMSPSELNDDDTEEYMLGCIVAHRCGVNGCCHDPWGIKVNGRATKFKTAADAPEDLRCYFCVDNPFYEVLFENDVPSLWVSAANSSNGDGGLVSSKRQQQQQVQQASASSLSSSRQPRRRGEASRARGDDDPFHWLSSDDEEGEDDRDSDGESEEEEQEQDEEVGEEQQQQEGTAANRARSNLVSLRERRVKKKKEDPCVAQWKTVPVTAMRAFHRVVPVGSKLLIRIADLQKVLPFFMLARQTHLIKRTRNALREEQWLKRGKTWAEASRFKRGPRRHGRHHSGADAPLMMMVSRVAMAMQAKGGVCGQKQKEDANPCAMHDPEEDQSEETVGKAASPQRSGGWQKGMSKKDMLCVMQKRMEGCMLQCYLNVSSVLCNKDGLVCVSISCLRTKAEHAGMQVRSMYVPPQFLRMPRDEKQWGAALENIYI
jgi:hypothetical protein